MGQIKKIILIILGLSILAIIFKISTLSLTDLIEKSVKINFFIFSILVILKSIVFWAMAKRWEISVSLFTKKIKFPRGFFLFYCTIGLLTSSLFSTMLGNAGSRTIALNYHHKIPTSKALSTIFIDLLCIYSFCGLMIIPSLFALLNIISIKYAIYLIPIYVVCLFFIVLYFFNPLKKIIILLIKKTQTFFIKKNILKEKMQNLELDFLDHLNITTVLKLYFYTLIVYSVQIIFVLTLIQGTEITIFWKTYLLVFPVAYFLAAFGGLITTIGLTDLGWFGTLLIFGVDASNAALYVFSMRFLHFLVVLVCSIFASLLYYFSKKKQTKLSIATTNNSII